MSVQIRHDAYSLDSQQTELFWYDDFLGTQRQDEWATDYAGSGSTVVVDDAAGGVCRVTTGATATNYSVLYQGAYNVFTVSKSAAFETRLKLNSGLRIRSYVGLYNHASWHRISFQIGNDSDSLEHWRETAYDGSETSPESTTLSDTNFNILRVQSSIYGSNHVHYYVNNTETSNSPLTTNIPTAYLSAYFYFYTYVNSEKSFDIDYVGVKQLI